MPNVEMFGAFASIRIRYAGDIRSLSERLATALNVPSLKIQASEYPPYEDLASAETLGWEVWLESVRDDREWFTLRIETEHAVDEVLHGRMRDLSPWFARFVALVCEQEAEPASLHSEAHDPRN